MWTLSLRLRYFKLFGDVIHKHPQTVGVIEISSPIKASLRKTRAKKNQMITQLDEVYMQSIHD